MFEISQASMNDAGGTAGCTGSKIMLLDDKHTSSCSGALARDRRTIDTAADDYDVKVLAIKARPCAAGRHLWFDAFLRGED
jgi:hypothetical protein